MSPCIPTSARQNMARGAYSIALISLRPKPYKEADFCSSVAVDGRLKSRGGSRRAKYMFGLRAWPFIGLLTATAVAGANNRTLAIRQSAELRKRVRNRKIGTFVVFPC